MFWEWHHRSWWNNWPEKTGSESICKWTRGRSCLLSFASCLGLHLLKVLFPLQLYQMKKLTGIVWPLIAESAKEKLAEFYKEKCTWAVMEAAVLLEANWDSCVSAVMHHFYCSTFHCSCLFSRHKKKKTTLWLMLFHDTIGGWSLVYDGIPRDSYRTYNL